MLEEQGLLTHPHTSAGRVPTDAGYRLFVDRLLDRLEARPAGLELDLSGVESQVDSALRATTEALADLTHLLALVSAPPLETTIVRHVEVLLLQPHVVMVVVITSTGGVTKRLLTFEQPVDVGLADWAGQYLNETVAGLRLGARLLRSRFEDAALSDRERGFLDRLRPAFTEVLEAEEQTLYVGGTADVLDEFRADELRTYRHAARGSRAARGPARPPSRQPRLEAALRPGRLEISRPRARRRLARRGSLRPSASATSAP